MKIKLPLGPYKMEKTMTNEKEVDMVNNPPHYTVAGPIYESIKIIEAWQLNFNLGNAIKYILRSEHKGNKIEDLKKARWYLNREIDNMEVNVIKDALEKPKQYVWFNTEEAIKNIKNGLPPCFLCGLSAHTESNHKFESMNPFDMLKLVPIDNMKNELK